MYSSGSQSLVMKFGGAAVASPESFASIAKIIAKRRMQYSRICVVVSAMGDTTDELLRLAQQVNPNPPQRELDMLVSVGERISVSLLAMALDRIGIEAVSFTGSQAGVITCARHTDARIIDVRPYRVLEQLEAGRVVLIAGFQGVSIEKEITTLGRGGSDTTAVALAAALAADQVEFYKDVEGVFERDPKADPAAPLIRDMSYRDMRDLIERGASVLSGRCVEIAARNGIRLEVRSFSDDEKTGTVVREVGGDRLEVPMYEEG